MRNFVVRLTDYHGNAVADPITVHVPDHIPLKQLGKPTATDRLTAHPAAVEYIVGRVAVELAGKAASQAIFAGPDEDEDFRRRVLT